MDPGRVEVEMVREEEQRWPGWTRTPIHVPEEYFQRREEEWRLADRIVVNSQWSADALVHQGVPPERLVVIPLAFETKAGSGHSKTPHPIASQRGEGEIFNPSNTPLRVLFLGQVVLRKGIQYLVEAAKLLANESVQFDVVGPIGISDAARSTAPPNMLFHGRTGRDEAAAWYERSDVFVLPTISDGFALTQIEAMAHGLPVITTPNCGAVVMDGVDGYIVPSRDSAALAQAVQRYLLEPELWHSQHKAAKIKAKQFSLAKLSEEFAKLEEKISEKTKTELTNDE